MNQKTITHTHLPEFSRPNPQLLVETLTSMIKHVKNQMESLLAQAKPFTWDNLVLPLDEALDALQQFWAPIQHLQAVDNQPDYQEVYQTCLGLLSDFYTHLGQDAQLYQAYQTLAASCRTDPSSLDAAQKQALILDLQSFERSGVALPPEKKTKVEHLQKALSELANQFEQNLLSATDAWSLHLKDSTQTMGLPEHALDAARLSAQEKSLPGFLFTLHQPSYLALITYLDDRDLRQRVYKAYQTRASDQVPDQAAWDNSAIMVSLLEKRQALAESLGYAHYADYALVQRMARSQEEVCTFLTQLAERVRPVAMKEKEALEAFARDRFNLSSIEAWDIPYLSEKYRQHAYDFYQEKLRDYFPLPHVLAGLFTLIKRLFQVDIQPFSAPTWHTDVQVFQLNTEGRCLGYLYMDLFARTKKRSGAWMDDPVPHRKTASGATQLPVAFLTCNFAKPVADNRPALLTHEDVLTLFHECGHCLHHLASEVDCLSVSGLHGVPWDAVELPSQCFENFCWEPEVLKGLLSAHCQTHEPIPDTLIQALLLSKNFQVGLRLARQLEFALFDWALHKQQPALSSADAIQACLDQVRAQVAVFPSPTFNRFQHSFSHIFAGGYAAGYYAYLWADTLAMDAFSLFKEQGIFNPDIGRAYFKEILAKGGSRPIQVSFEAFRGRPQSMDAFLNDHGLL